MDINRGQWNSQIGFIFAAAGSAIGLGNIWRFPYVVGENGGAAFVLLYLFFVLIIGIPTMIAEFSLGRHANKNPIGAINNIKPNSYWRFLGLLGIITGMGILSFYGVIAGWTTAYIFKTAMSNTDNFESFIADPLIVILMFAFFILLTTTIVHGGIEKGIEKWSKILMPVMIVLLLGLIIYSNTLEGSSKGLEFYLSPDFSKITGKTVMSALGQAFFSLSLGMGMMVTYGSYLSKKANIAGSAVIIGMMDTMIAIMAGLIIFPALFSLGESPAHGAALVFIIFPKMFVQMPGGIIIGSLFFLLLSVAALTSTISLMEVGVTYLVDEKKIERRKIVWGVAIFIFIIGLPSALSQGAVESLTDFALFPEWLCNPDFMSHMSFLFLDFSLAFGALMMSIFIAWVWGADKASDEIEIGSSGFRRFRTIWMFMIKFFIPIVVFIILLNLFGIFGTGIN